jgi:adenylate cyclase
MDTFNTENKLEGLPELKMRIAINSGEVVVGNIGSDTRAKYGIVGAPVNLTNRIQTTARAGEVVISESAYRHVGKKTAARKLSGIELKGVQEPVNVYVVKAGQKLAS